MGIENASQVMRILGGIKPIYREEQEFFDNAVVGILESTVADSTRLSIVLRIPSGKSGCSICTDMYFAQMLEAYMIAHYEQADKILNELLAHVRETVKSSAESWMIAPAAIVAALNVSTWVRSNSATVGLNEEYEANLYYVVGCLMAFYFRNVPDDAPECSKQIIGQFNDALVQHTSASVLDRQNMTEMVMQFRGNRNSFKARAYDMANKFTHRAMSVLAFGNQMDALIEAYEFRDEIPRHRASAPSQVM